jgi:NAD(P)-dependent dehydrogenase (short-subunit alcohol dehydrogenase family)
MVSYDYSGQVIFITGAASGIGLGGARAFAEAGATVAIADINAKAADAVAADLRDQGHKAEAFGIDVADEASAKAAVDAVVAHFGKLDVAINNAGVEMALVPLAQVSADEWNRLIGVNLTGMFYCMKAQLPHFEAQGKGVILNTASVSSFLGAYNMACYTATKHAVIGLTRAAACDYAAKNIRINALCPGLVETPILGEVPKPVMDHIVYAIPQGRTGTPAEMGAAMLWLCSDAASYVVGSSMLVDGGASLGAVATRFEHLF